MSQCPGDDELYIIGGSQVYECFLPDADMLHITLVHANITGDTHFPEITLNEWEQDQYVKVDRHDSRDDYLTSFITYKRRRLAQ